MLQSCIPSDMNIIAAYGTVVIKSHNLGCHQLNDIS